MKKNFMDFFQILMLSQVKFSQLSKKIKKKNHEFFSKFNAF